MKLDPTVLEILKVDKALKDKLHPITTGALFDNNMTLHSEGLFSTEIFGRVGSEERNLRFARIDLNIKLIKPIIYDNLLKLGSLYERIMSGKEYAIFNEKTKDFEISQERGSDTGYHFFMKHFPFIKFRETGSERRSQAIKMIYDSFKNDTTFTDISLVLPAGLRDYTTNRSGRAEEDEINTFYRRILNISMMIDPDRAKSSPKLYDNSAYGLQKSLQSLYEYVMSLVEGGRKLIQAKWMSRKVFNTTSNVASVHVERTKGLDDPRYLKYNETYCGLYQYCRSAAPLSQYWIRSKYIPGIFPDEATTVYLTNATTLKREEVPLQAVKKEVDLWTTPDGLDKVIASIGNPDIRNEPIRIRGTSRKDYYMGLLYRDDQFFKFFQDIDDLPEGYDREKVKPVTIYEFLYMSIYNMSGEYPGYINRYPITGYGSIYPTMIKIATTADTDILRELGPDWMPQEGPEFLATNFPIDSSGYIGTIVIHTAHLGALGGDNTKGF